MGRPIATLRRHLLSPLLARWRLLTIGIALMTLEVFIHTKQFAINRPATDLDPPFHVGCQAPVLNGNARANAAIVMLARNSDVDGAVSSVQSLQQQFNRHFNYPWVFLNDKEWSKEFKERVGKAVGSESTAEFQTIPKSMWGFPEWIDKGKARREMDKMERRGLPYAGIESYHHMCRFQSGFFYDHPALEKYKWYWRVEPDVSFTCAITYDPFVEMEKHGKRYGYTIALWENGKTAASLFRAIADYKKTLQLRTTSLWTAMMKPSWAPWPFRGVMAWIRNRDGSGDLWNTCHFWSNFEIADLDFFRSAEYRRLFDYLDRDGGFYYERWGDAPVHSLAAALLLRPEEIHHFSDFGYVHADLQYCTNSPTAEQRKNGELVPDLGAGAPKREKNPELGCQCTCDKRIERINPTCFNSIKRSVM